MRLHSPFGLLPTHPIPAHRHIRQPPKNPLCRLSHLAFLIDAAIWCRFPTAVHTYYLRVPKLNEELAIEHGSGRYARWLAQLAKTDLMIVDDLAMAPLTDSARRDLLEVLDDRHGHRSTLATSQIPVDH